MKEVGYECTYCPRIGNQFRVSELEYMLIKVDPGCPNCKQPWAYFRKVEAQNDGETEKDMLDPLIRKTFEMIHEAKNDGNKHD